MRWVARGHDAFDGQVAGVAVIGVEPVPAPRVVPEHDVGPVLADPVGDLPPLAEARLQLTVGPAEEDALARAAEGP